VALVKPMPIYPRRSLNRSSQGVVVIKLTTDIKGNVTQAKILQSPDRYISEATLHAVKRWKFKEAKHRMSLVNISGKLTFYFSIKSGKGVVDNP
jgi:TonB family protein